MSQKRIAFQGELGANSHEICNAAYPDYDPIQEWRSRPRSKKAAEA